VQCTAKCLTLSLQCGQKLNTSLSLCCLMPSIILAGSYSACCLWLYFSAGCAGLSSAAVSRLLSVCGDGICMLVNVDYGTPALVRAGTHLA